MDIVIGIIMKKPTNWYAYRNKFNVTFHKKLLFYLHVGFLDTTVEIFHDTMMFDFVWKEGVYNTHHKKGLNIVGYLNLTTCNVEVEVWSIHQSCYKFEVSVLINARNHNPEYEEKHTGPQLLVLHHCESKVVNWLLNISALVKGHCCTVCSLSVILSSLGSGQLRELREFTYLFMMH